MLGGYNVLQETWQKEEKMPLEDKEIAVCRLV